MKFSKILIAFVFSTGIFSAPSFAQSQLNTLALPIAQGNQQFMIAGLLQSKADKQTVRLVQGKQTTSTPDLAIKAFAEDVKLKFPDYVLIDTLVTPINATSAPTMGKSDIWLTT